MSMMIEAQTPKSLPAHAEQGPPSSPEQAFSEDPALNVYQLVEGVSFSQVGEVSPVAEYTSPSGVDHTLDAMLAAGDNLFAVTHVKVPGHETKLAVSLVSSEPEGSSRLIGFVDEGAPLVIGRGKKTEINDPTLSRRHFEIAKTSKTGFDVKDLDSTNGTLLAKRGSEIVKDQPAKRALGGLRRLVSAKRGAQKGQQKPISQSGRWVISDAELSDYFDAVPQRATDNVRTIQSDFIDPSLINNHELASNAQRYDFRDGRVGDITEIELADGSVIKGKIVDLSPFSPHKDDSPLMPRIELLNDYTPLKDGKPGKITYFAGDKMHILGAGTGAVIAGNISRHTPVGYGAQYRVPPEKVKELEKAGYTLDEKGRVYLELQDGELMSLSEHGFKGPSATSSEVAHFSVTRRTSKGEDRKTRIF